MITKFKLKADAEAFCRELEDSFGVGTYHCIYKGHRHWCVRHNIVEQGEYVSELAENNV